MSPAELFRRAAALLVAVGLFAVLVAGVSADDGNEGSEGEVALQPTEVVADIPEGYDALFPLQWGGGSLYQLKGRLATMGCMANTIWLYDGNKWNVYNQYNVSPNNSIIQQFLQQYEQFIPATSLWANCYNICELGGEQCLSFDELREQEGNFREYFAVLPYLDRENFEIDETTPCTRDFHPVVQKQVLPTLPTRPDACVVRKTTTGLPSGTGGTGGYAWYESVNTPPFFIVHDNSSLWYREYKEYKDLALNTEIHEMCHINQNWQQLQGLTTEQGFNEDNHIWFKNSPQGKEFIEMVGFIDLGYWQWDLPQNSIYRNIYSRNPIELSAELCAMYLLDKIGATQRYNYERWVATGYAFNGYFTYDPTRNFNVNKYLTPEVRQWLETYIILPDISE